ncbi:unnamed protein product [Closterium sp. NIES-53]
MSWCGEGAGGGEERDGGRRAEMKDDAGLEGEAWTVRPHRYGLLGPYPLLNVPSPRSEPQGDVVRVVLGEPKEGEYALEADVWSLGVILYILLCGAPPFWGPTDKDVFVEVLKGVVDFSGEEWAGVSEEAKRIVLCLLQRDPKRRPAAVQILSHPWILRHCHASVAGSETGSASGSGYPLALGAGLDLRAGVEAPAAMVV